MQLNPNTKLQGGKYRIIRVLGQGGFGITYLAEHTMLDKLVAIKEFFPKEYCDRDESTSHITVGSKNSVELVGQLKNKFIKEAKNISKLRHTNIITIHDIFEENASAYYVMEYVEGHSLSQIMKKDGAMEESRAIEFVRKIADAVGYMHSLNMNHLDLKPANIMVREVDSEPILIDFGLSKQYDNSGGQTSSTPIGISHGYAPIEQYRPGGVATFTPQTDIYALGATLFALLTGDNPPHYSDILEDGLPALPATVSQRAADAIEHAMEIKKNKRPESVTLFLSELIADEKPAEKIVEKPKPQPITEPKKPTEETVLIVADPVVEKPKIEVSAPKNIVIDGIEFVDLGLSVRWANMNIGAKKPSDIGTFIDKTVQSETNAVLEFNLKGAKIPTIGQWEELKNHCKWEWTELNDVGGYKVIGRNGNWIFLPFNGESSNISFRTFGRLFTRETFYSSNHNQFEQYYFYFAHGGTYKLTRYSLSYRCPVRLVYEK